MQYGNALERLVGERISQDPLYRQVFEYVGGKGQPDFYGRGPAMGLYFDIFTSKTRQIQGHWNRPYGPRTSFGTYERPANFAVFP
jgi:hypothetical protein